ncbi:MAG: ABC transporter, partial [Ottowia sp.]
MPTFVSVPSRAALAALAAAVLAAGCSSVDLGPRYNPPPVRMPQPLPAPSAPAALPPLATAQPV